MTEAAESGPDGPRPGGGSVELVGTAHVSAESVEEVERTIEERRPDVVAVELDEDRFRQLKGEAPEDLEPGDLIGGNTVFQFLAYWMLSYVQTRLGKKFDIEPGADMLAAVDTAEEFGLDVALVDRDIQTTIQRFWRRMTLLEKLKMVGSLLLGTIGLQFGDSEVDDLEMEDLTDADVVTVLLEEFRAFSPGGAEALIDERDAYIAHNLVALREQGYDVVAVIGAGHEPGIRNYLEHPEQLPPMESLVGQASGRGIPWFKIIGWVASIGFLSFFVLLALGVQDNWLVVQVLALWFVINGVFAAGLAKLAGARWTSASVGGLVAWMTSINPLLAPGWFVGYVELRYTNVNVSDIGKMNEIIDDEESPIREVFGRLLEVPLFRLVAIVAMTNVGSIIASVLFGIAIIPFLGDAVGGVDQIPDVMLDGAREGWDRVVGVFS